MDDDLIVTAYVVIDETMAALGHRSHRLARVSDAEVLTVAVVAAKYCANNHERALAVMHGMRYLARPRSWYCQVKPRWLERWRTRACWRRAAPLVRPWPECR